MDKGLMGKEDMAKFGLDIDVDLAASKAAQKVSAGTTAPGR
jgi:hypothetical protein